MKLYKGLHRSSHVGYHERQPIQPRAPRRRPTRQAAPPHHHGLEPDETGKRRTVRRGGFARRKDAQDALDEMRGKATKGVDVSRKITVAEYLREWIKGKTDIRDATRVSYTHHITALWIPKVGRHELSAMRRTHVQDALDSLDLAPASVQRFRATLRAALNDAVREGLVSVNVAELVKLPSGKRPKTRVWQDARVLQWSAEYETRLAAARKRAANASAFKVWRNTSARPSAVMVWTPAQVGRYFDHVAQHRLYALFHLIALRGLRRGEACGLRREDVDLQAGLISAQWQVSKPGGKITPGPVKTDASDATVALDAGTVEVLRAHLQAHGQERTQWAARGRRRRTCSPARTARSLTRSRSQTRSNGSLSRPVAADQAARSASHSGS
nr:Arm DNA-binding domain-containing protein [Phytoactinopolyspora endophytica]